ncbi:MAG: hypothetical protein EBR41_04970 [Crocinitomicaceae bacterium]|nr:hypothetical protein [Crocinitomicaceae bacterium]
MKTKDQKQLEFLYEQVNAQFTLLDEENQYFDKVTEELADHIVSKAAGLTKFADSDQWIKKTLTNFDDQLFVEPLPSFFNNSITTPLEFAINTVYKDYIIYNALTVTYVTRYLNSSQIKLELKHPYNHEHIMDVVDITDKNGIKEALKKNLIKTLEIWSTPAATDDDTIMWHNWRQYKLKFQKITNRLPELKGMFD